MAFGGPVTKFHPIHAAVLQEKAAIKAEKDAAEAKYKMALVDGKEEPVGVAGIWG